MFCVLSSPVNDKGTSLGFNERELDSRKIHSSLSCLKLSLIQSLENVISWLPFSHIHPLGQPFAPQILAESPVTPIFGKAVLLLNTLHSLWLSGVPINLSFIPFLPLASPPPSSGCLSGASGLSFFQLPTPVFPQDLSLPLSAFVFPPPSPWLPAVGDIHPLPHLWNSLGFTALLGPNPLRVYIPRHGLCVSL